MIKLMDKMQIIQLHLSGKSNRLIARELGLNRKTVNKYVNEYEKAQATILANGQSQDCIHEATERIVAEPKYKERKPTHRKWNEEMDDFLEKILAAEEEKRKRLKTSKQQLTKTQIHALMRAEGFDIGLTTVCKMINLKQEKANEAFIAQSYPYGKRFEYDFGEAHIYIAGKFTRAYLAVMTAPASGYRYALLYRNQKFSVFVDSQVRFFEHLGGCFEQGVYDNMKNVVSKFVGRTEKLLNKDLLSLAAYYGFNVVTTNVRSGNEKGSVENAVKVVRNAAFAKKWEFESFEEAEQYLSDILLELNADKPIDQERKCLTPYRVPYEVADIRPGALVDKYSCITVDNVHYSVPDFYVGKKVLVKVYPNEIVIMCGKEVLARHARSFDKGAMVLDIRHYLKTFTRKPGALANSTVLKSYTELKEIFDAYYKDNPREFISILQSDSHADINEAKNALLSRTSQPHISHTTCLHDNAIARQTLEQIKQIKAIGRGAA